MVERFSDQAIDGEPAKGKRRPAIKPEAHRLAVIT